MIIRNMRTRFSLFGAFVAAVLVAAAVSGAAPASAEAEEQPLRSVSITRDDMCLGCKLTLDAYIAAVKADAESKKRQRMDPRTTEINGNRIAEQLCKQPPFTDKYTESVRYACMKMTQEHLAELLSLFGGKQVNIFMDRSQSEVFRNREKLCLQVEACTSDNFIYSGPTDECAGCKLLTENVDAYYRAHKLMTTQELTEYAEELCSKLPREFGPRVANWLSDVCFDLMDEYSEKIARMLALRRKAEAKGLVMSQPLHRTVCHDLTHSCKNTDNNNKSEL